jgi:hypothetical protein
MAVSATVALPSAPLSFEPDVSASQHGVRDLAKGLL